MAVYKHLIALLALFSMITTALAANNDIPTDLVNQYSIFLNSGIASSEIDTHLAWVEDLHKNSPGFKQGLAGVTSRFDIGDTHGYNGEFDESTARQINDRPEVSFVLQDDLAEINAIIKQESAPWGLAALSSREPGASSYKYDDRAGEGFFAYIVEAGSFETELEEFGGRLSQAANFTIILPHESQHGTAVAGLIGSNTYGAAKKAQMLGVTVGSTANGMMQGLLWSIEDIKDKKRSGRAVINLSMSINDRTYFDGNTRANLFKKIWDDAWNQGILIFNSAGNEGLEVSKDERTLPSVISGPHITVGSLSENWDKASHSNFGPFVDIYAPGHNITYLTKDGVSFQEGTSFACPLVAGMALTLLANMDPLPKAEDTARILATQILDLATEHKVGAIPGAGPDEFQRVAYNGGLDPR